MALIVIFDEGASPEQVLQVIPSANTPEYSSRSDVLVNPDISALQGIIPRRYWKRVLDTVVEYTQAEKDAQDAAEAAAEVAAVRAGAKNQHVGFSGLPVYLRAFADVVREEINILRALHSLQDRTLAQLKTAIENRIDSGGVDS
jgi:hypothetical protein